MAKKVDEKENFYFTSYDEWYTQITSLNVIRDDRPADDEVAYSNTDFTKRFVLPLDVYMEKLKSEFNLHDLVDFRPSALNLP